MGDNVWGNMMLGFGLGGWVWRCLVVGLLWPRISGVVGVWARLYHVEAGWDSAFSLSVIEGSLFGLDGVGASLCCDSGI